MFFLPVCHFRPFLLSAGRQIDTGRRTSKEAGRQAGRQGAGEWCSRKAVYSMWATVLPSWLGVVNQLSPPGPISHSQTFTTACSPACDGKGCCHSSYRSCGMSLSDRGISPIWAWSLKCSVLSLSVCGLHVLSNAKSLRAPVSWISHSFGPKCELQSKKKDYRCFGW